MTAMLNAFKTIQRPLVCLPTGSGKSPVIAAILNKLSKAYPNEQFVCTVHTQELIGQLAETFKRMSGIEPAIYSASLRRKEFGRVTFAQIQSIYRKAFDIGRIKLLIVDECDRIPMEGNGQYRTFISECESINPKLRVGGFTATPYRLHTGLVYGDKQPFSDLVYDADIRTLINGSFLSGLVSKDGGAPDVSDVKITNGDFNATELDAILSDEATVSHAIDEILRYSVGRNAWLIFCSSITHANMVSAELTRRGVEAPIIEGNTKDSVRKELVTRYQNKDLKCLVNVNVLSIGFDAPHVDMIVMMRPTLSPGLYYQQVGRGLRIAPGKNNCLILDLAGNINRHGPIDTLNQRIKAKKSAKEKGEAPTKTCPQCSEIIHAASTVCPSCLFEFPPPKIAKHDTVACVEEPLSAVAEHSVDSWYFTLNKGKENRPDTICVHYKQGHIEIAREYLSPSINAKKFARFKFLQFLQDNLRHVESDCPLTIGDSGVRLATHDGVVEILDATAMLPGCRFLIKPTKISYVKDGIYFNIIKRTYEDRSNPEASESELALSALVQSES